MVLDFLILFIFEDFDLRGYEEGDFLGEGESIKWVEIDGVLFFDKF